VTQQTTRRNARQSAIRIFAQEYSDANLPEEGSGEYDPSFIITKLGAKINRALVGGVIDRLERREGDNGPSYNGHLRDATGGTHRFNIAAFQPELHTDIEELLHRFEAGDRFLMMVIGKARWFESDDGGIFTSFRAEEFCVVERETYVRWLVDTAAATLRRLDAQAASLESDLTPAGLEAAGVPKDLVDGMILAKGHYGEFDAEIYRVGVLQGLHMAMNSSGNFEAAPTESFDAQPTASTEPQQSTVMDGVPFTPTTSSEPDGNVDDVIKTAISIADQGQGVPYDSLILAAVQAGFSRLVAEDAIDDLRDVKCEIIEPRFGFFQILDD
jgi:RPA family protein